MSTVLIRIEIRLEIDWVDMEIYDDYGKRVYIKVGFSPDFQTSYVFLAIAAEYNFVFDIMLYYVLDVLCIYAIGFKIGQVVMEIA